MLKPLQDYVVLLQPDAEKETKTASGIILKKDKDERQVKAKVVAIGPGRFEDGNVQPMHVKVGQTVIFKSYSSTEVNVDDTTYLLVKESDILAILEG